jgi:hypothetical protein
MKQLKQNLKSNPVYFDRVKGIFRVCFPFTEKPKPNWFECYKAYVSSSR